MKIALESDMMALVFKAQRENSEFARQSDIEMKRIPPKNIIKLGSQIYSKKAMKHLKGDTK